MKITANRLGKLRYDSSSVKLDETFFYNFNYPKNDNNKWTISIVQRFLITENFVQTTNPFQFPSIFLFTPLLKWKMNIEIIPLIPSWHNSHLKNDFNFERIHLCTLHCARYTSNDVTYHFSSLTDNLP